MSNPRAIWCRWAFSVKLRSGPAVFPPGLRRTDRPEGASALAKRPRNLWRRPNSSFRLGQKKPTDVNMDEQRLTLYLPAFVLDWAEQQANRANIATVQDYCAGLLRDAIEDVRSREQVAEAEARSGALQGFRAITEDPEYLAEWSASVLPRDPNPAIQWIEADPTDPQADAMPPGPSPAALVVLRHSASGAEDPSAFLASLRRGESVTEAASGELLQALNALEVEYRDARAIDRRVA
jgi:hypothetical protein